MDIKILHEDDNIVVAYKPHGVPSQADKTGDLDIVTYLTKECRAKYIGVINRLDRPVGGIMVFAKNPQSAAKLSLQLQKNEISKQYTAVICGELEERNGEMVDYLLKNQKDNISKVANKGTKEAKEARLKYSVLDTVEDVEWGKLSLVKVDLITGRHHQIRVQFSSRNLPLWGDNKYNETFKKRRGFTEIALCSTSLGFKHPKTNEKMEFEVKAEGEAFRIFEAEF
ncbi:MAG: RluA family pseudouridine synthase [Lachnospiraceae bacterium]|nr:RluA family pseudouridine synthase [Lachnospiraceae bacterium]